jgi:hypothetical protein
MAMTLHFDRRFSSSVFLAGGKLVCCSGSSGARPARFKNADSK